MGLIEAGLGVAMNLFGAFGAASARRRAEEERRKLLLEMSRKNDEFVNSIRSGNLLQLRTLTAGLNDNLVAHGGALGDSMAAAGVYNNSAVSGALERNAAENAALIARSQAQGMLSEQQARLSGEKEVMNAKMGIASEDVSNARGQEANAQYGLGTSLTSLITNINPRNNGAAMNGNQGSKPLAPGAGGGGGPLDPSFTSRLPNTPLDLDSPLGRIFDLRNPTRRASAFNNTPRTQLFPDAPVKPLSSRR